MKQLLAFAVITFLATLSVVSQEKPVLNVIPYPSKVILRKGNFKITKTTLLNRSDQLSQECSFLNGLIENGIGTKLGLGAGESNVIKIAVDHRLKHEEYALAVSTDIVSLSGGSPAGVFRGLQTLRQMFSDQVEVDSGKLKALSIPCVLVSDLPVFDYRGLHLDVSRHFFTIEFLKKYLDVMALYKFNKLHLHLTDDQGWRIEIKKYPKLTSEGAWRTFNNQDSACIVKSKENPDMAIDPRFIVKKDGVKKYGGFYTQAQMIDLVSYAKLRHIEIIPEIDMPGHMMAAIKAYPYLSCTGTSNWGKLFTTPICPCNESTYDFAEDVFREIFEIFPSQYIHIGGDEVDRASWQTNQACAELMKREGIKNTAGLQSYFINRMEKFFLANGKKIIGWDEILEEGISTTAMVMYWRSWVPLAPLAALKNGNRVIMTPGEPLYFDYLPNKNSLYDVYNFKVIPKNYPESGVRNIYGAQANLWTEMVPSENRAEYMVFPRALALAENLWSHHHLDFNSFSRRLLSHYPRLDLLAVKYRLPDLENVITERVFMNRDSLYFDKPINNMKLRYTLNGSIPNMTSNELSEKLKINHNTAVTLGVFAQGDTAIREIYKINFKKQDMAEAMTVSGKHAGLIGDYYKFLPDSLSTGAGKKVDSTFIIKTISVPKTVDAPTFQIDFTGIIDVPQDGVYTFYLDCDDSGVLSIADRLVVDNGGMHSSIEKNGQVALKKGGHRFNLIFKEGGGGYKLRLLYSFNNSSPAAIPSTWLKH
ncbi:family 20 glycosylhydrolase [Pedobacter sp. MC2016-05]|uniref:family 20 glycosylhydrolase n=1 Tax=Pedobacter sp. MC2016-05 TaxID=2994474 RepID=UPI002245A998|nr:family 20 glycosylhydrolase [Pedobacter sp. MC2016-05]MCX2475308.1 family 20 glycosylhydrolase [Pedobacter sp. MC2016-05]